MAKRSQAKKVERPGLNQDEIDALRQAFDLADPQCTERVTPKDLKSSMQSLGMNTSYPDMFKHVSSLDTPESQERMGDQFDEFVEKINNLLGDQEGKEGIQRIFNLFVDDPARGTITFLSLRRLARELGEQNSVEDLSARIIKYSASGNEITFEEFFAAMNERPEDIEAFRKAASNL